MRRNLVIIGLIATFAACGATEKSTKRKGKRSSGKATASSLLKQGIRAEANGQPTLARKKYERSLRLRPNHFDAVKRLTRLYLRQRKNAKAIRLAEDYHDHKMEDVAGSHLLAHVRIKTGDYKGAFDTLSEIIETHANNAAAYEKRGAVQVLFGKFPKGVADLQKAVQLAPDNVKFRVSLGSGLQQAGRLNEAAIELRKALQVEKENPRAHLVLGIVLRKNSDITEAYYHHMKAVKFAPKSSRAHFELGITQDARGDSVGSEASLALAVKLDPGNATNWYAYGEISRGLKKWSRAKNAYETALKLKPKFGKARSKLAVVLYYLKQYERAEAMLTVEIRKNPRKPYAYFNLGLVYSAQKKYGMAIGSLRKFINLAPKGDGDVKEARRKIRWIRKRM